MNQLIKEIYADGGVRTFRYDGVGNLVQRVNQKGQKTNYLYDDLHRLTNRTYSDPSTTYDSFTYDKGGRMLTAESGDRLIQFSYDKANRLNYTIQDDTMISYTYDVPNNTRTIYYPGGKVITETMDERNRLYGVNDGDAVPIADFDYDLGDRILTRTYRNGVVAEYNYNKNDRVTQLVHKNGADLIAGFEYEFDKEGNKKFEKKPHDLTHSEAYKYNDIYQLINYKVGELVGSTVPMPSIQTTYNLDGVGNWLDKITDGAVENRTHNEVNEITAIDSQPNYHDANGNLIDDGTYTYEYDTENRLTKVIRKANNVVIGKYRYDALGRRIEKEVSGIITIFIYDSGRIIEERRGGSMVAQYVYGSGIDEVLTMDRCGAIYYYHTNSLGSIVSLTNVAGDVVEHYRYDAYGKPEFYVGPGLDGTWFTGADVAAIHSTVGNSYLFTARRYDEETGLYYYRARYYGAERGRFLQRDPALGYVDGMNLYEYMRSSPINFLDPEGLCTTYVTKVYSRYRCSRWVFWPFSWTGAGFWTMVCYYRVTEHRNTICDCPDGYTYECGLKTAYYSGKKTHRRLGSLLTALYRGSRPPLPQKKFSEVNVRFYAEVDCCKTTNRKKIR